MLRVWLDWTGLLPVVSFLFLAIGTPALANFARADVPEIPNYLSEQPPPLVHDCVEGDIVSLQP